MICRSEPVFAQSRIMFPVLLGISGLKRTILKIKSPHEIIFKTYDKSTSIVAQNHLCNYSIRIVARILGGIIWLIT